MSDVPFVRAVWILAASLALVSPGTAQNIVSRPGTVDRSLDRLTLLPGPYLLSPGRGVAETRRTDTNLGTFRFLPATRHPDSSRPRPAPMATPSGKLVLAPNPGPAVFLPAKAGVPASLPHPDSLRFDARLPAEAAVLPLRPAPRVTRE